MKSEDIGNQKIREGQYTVIIIVNQKIIDNNTLSWHEKNYKEFGERYITLKEIYRQLSKHGIKDVIYVWEETPLRGTIYQCSNYQKGLWQEHGTTKGYA